MSATRKLVAIGGGSLLTGVAASAWMLRPRGPGVGSDSDANKESPLSSPPPNNKKRQRLPDPKPGDKITVLSIDGGGIRGLIPTVILDVLERELQRLEGGNPNARIADYFDVIAGTSTGGLIAAMLAVPDVDDKEQRGLPKTAAEIQTYYCTNGKQIFSPRGWLYAVKSFFYGPRYDCRFLHDEIKRITDGKTIGETFTNIVIPAFDIGMLQTVIFSSFKPVSDNEELNLPLNKRAQLPLLSDVCIATTAAPTYLPAHFFKSYYKDQTTLRRDYHLIDGGVGANNPTMVAISRIAREVLCKNDRFKHFKGEMDYKNMAVISIGTGSTSKKGLKQDLEIYKAKDCAKWGTVGWIFNWGRKPILDMIRGDSDFFVDLQVAVLLQSHGCGNYLRIQALEVDKECYSMHSADNMGKLVKIGNDLLDRHVYRVDLYTGWYDEDYDERRHKTGTINREKLKAYAKTLKAERDRRLERANNQS